MNLIIRSTVTTGCHSFREVIEFLLGSRSVLATEVAVILNNAGGLIVYLIIIGDVLAGSDDFGGLLADAGAPLNDRRFSVALVVLLLVGPLCMLRRVEQLKITSAASLLLSFTFILITVVLVVLKLAKRTIGRVNWVPARDVRLADVLQTLPMFVTAYGACPSAQAIFRLFRASDILPSLPSPAFQSVTTRSTPW